MKKKILSIVRSLWLKVKALPDSPYTSAYWILVLLSIIEVIILWVKPPQIPIGADISSYLAFGLNISKGLGYSFAGEPVLFRPPPFSILLGNSIESARMVGKFFALITLGVTYLLASKLYGRLVGITSVAIAMTTLATANNFQEINIDSVQVSFILGSVLLCIIAFDNNKSIYALLSGLMMATSFYVKETAIMWVIIPFSLFITIPEYRRVTHIKLISIWLISFLGVAIWWWIYVYWISSSIYLFGSGGIGSNIKAMAQTNSDSNLIAYYTNMVFEAIRKVLLSRLQPSWLYVFSWITIFYISFLKNRKADRILLVLLLPQLLLLIWATKWQNVSPRYFVALYGFSFIATARVFWLVSIDFVNRIYKYFALSPGKKGFLNIFIVAGVILVGGITVQFYQTMSSPALNPKALSTNNFELDIIDETSLWMNNNIPPESSVLVTWLWAWRYHSLSDGKWDVHTFPQGKLRKINLDDEDFIFPTFTPEANYSTEKQISISREPHFLSFTYEYRRGFVFANVIEEVITEIKANQVDYIVVSGTLVPEHQRSPLGVTDFFRNHPENFTEVFSMTDADGQVSIFKVSNTEFIHSEQDSVVIDGPTIDYLLSEATGNEIAKKNVLTLLNQGRIEIQPRDLNTLGRYNALLRLYPGNPFLLVARGDEYLRLQNPELALADYFDALKHKPALSEAYLGQAGAYKMLGETLKAKSNYRKALEQGLSDPTVALLGLGDIYLQTGQLSEAKTYYQDVLKLHPLSPLAQLGIAKINAGTNDWLENLTYQVDQAVDPSLATDVREKLVTGQFMTMAQQFVDHGLPLDGAHVYIEILDREPENKRALLELANIYVASNNREKAISVLNRLTELWPEDSEPYIKLGQLYSYQNEDERVLDAYKTTLALDASAANFKRLGYFFRQENRVKDTIDVFSGASEKYRQSAWPHLELGQLYLEQAMSNAPN